MEVFFVKVRRSVHPFFSGSWEAIGKIGYAAGGFDGRRSCFVYVEVLEEWRSWSFRHCAFEGKLRVGKGRFEGFVEGYVARNDEVVSSERSR